MTGVIEIGKKPSRMQFQITNLGSENNFKWTLEVMEKEEQNSNGQVVLHSDWVTNENTKLRKVDEP